MNVNDFFTAGKITRICDVDDRVERQEMRQTVRREIANYYLTDFVDNLPDYDIEFADYRNQQVIHEIAVKWENELEQYFRTKCYQDFSRTVKAILAYMGVYVVTKYKRKRSIFDLSGFIASYVPDTMQRMFDYIPSNTKRFQALMDYCNSTGDIDTLASLNNFFDSKCKLV